MLKLSLNLDPVIKPHYDPTFIPIHVFNKSYRKELEESSHRESFSFGIMRGSVCIKKVELEILRDESLKEETLYYAERQVKSYLWVLGGDGIVLDGPEYLCEYLKKHYCEGGPRDFDVSFFQEVFKKTFRVDCDQSFMLVERDSIKETSGSTYQHKIGLDLGGSVIKAAALQGERIVFTKEEAWTPKINSDINYHYQMIKSLIIEASGHLPGFDFLGVSAAGIVIDNQVLVSSLFREIPARENYQNLLKAIAEEFGVKLQVANDGEVFALASKTASRSSSVLSLTLGTSTGGGYVSPEGRATNWINELAFVPLDVSDQAIQDEWSKDHGVGVSYLSQDAVVKLAKASGMNLTGETDALQFKGVLEALHQGSPEARQIFKDMGIYLAYALMYYREFYEIKHVVLGGGVMASLHGQIILESAREALEDIDADWYGEITITRAVESDMPTQSVVAANQIRRSHE